MGVKVREIRPGERQDHNPCRLCDPLPKGQVPADKVWAWAKAHPNAKVFR